MLYSGMSDLHTKHASTCDRESGKTLWCDYALARLQLTSRVDWLGLGRHILWMRKVIR